MEKRRRRHDRKPKEKPSLISILFDLLINKNKDSAPKLALVGKKVSTESIEERLMKEIKEEKEAKEENNSDLKDRLKIPELNLPDMKYFNVEEPSKLNYSSLFNYKENIFKTSYDEYKIFKYDGEGRLEFEQDVQLRKYERIIEKEMMGNFGFFSMEKVSPEEMEQYENDKAFGFRKAIIYLQYFMKPGSLRIVPGILYEAGNSNEENSKAA